MSSEVKTLQLLGEERTVWEGMGLLNGPSQQKSLLHACSPGFFLMSTNQSSVLLCPDKPGQPSAKWGDEMWPVI